ncbi:MAG: hypothetical protein ACRDPT_08180 [Streptomycetales bacterium]
MLGGLALFIAALGLMKTGAAALVPSLAGSWLTDNAWSTLGLGWFGACLLLSGSPVAASALALFDGGAIDWLQTFTMVTGSRLGAAFVVLIAGAIYALGKNNSGSRRPPLSIGVLALVMTSVVYVPGALLGLLLASTGMLGNLHVDASGAVPSLTDALLGWAVTLASTVLPGPLLFPLGVGVLLLGFRLFDKGMPQIRGDNLARHPDAWYRRTWPMFWLGCFVCLLTLSVSVALTVLVPLVGQRHLRLKDTIPYVAGANITTLADTLVAAALLGNPQAIQIVTTIAVTVAAWTLLLLIAAYPLLQRVCLTAVTALLASRTRLLAFCVALFGVPLALLVA